MARTDSGRVCAIIDTILGDEEVSAFITTANVFVTEYLGTSPLSASLLVEIETYVAAHFMTLKDRRVKKEEADGIKFENESDTGMGLDSSHYGQTAQVLDSTGTLSKLGSDDRVAWLARAGSEITDC